MSHFLRVSEATVKSVNEVNSKGENRVCDSGCRGFEPRFSPHFLLGFQLDRTKYIHLSIDPIISLFSKSYMLRVD